MLDEAGPRGGRAGERALGVAEQLGLEQRLGERRTIDGHEGARRPRAARMDGAGGELLARAGLTCDEHRPRGGGGALDQVLDLRHRAARADERVERQVRRNLTLQ